MIYVRSLSTTRLSKKYTDIMPHQAVSDDINIIIKNKSIVWVFNRGHWQEVKLGINDSLCPVIRAEDMRLPIWEEYLQQTNRYILPLTGFTIETSKQNMHGISIPKYFESTSVLLCACVMDKYLKNTAIIEIPSQYSDINTRIPLFLSQDNYKNWLSDANLPRIVPHTPKLTSKTISTNVLWTKEHSDIKLLNYIKYT